MNKLFSYWIIAAVFLSSGCKNRSETDKDTSKIVGDTYEFFVVPSSPDNIRNSEAAIVRLKDGSLLLAWTEFLSDSGADHAPARISGKISTDEGRTWGKRFPNVMFRSFQYRPYSSTRSYTSFILFNSVPGGT